MGHRLVSALLGSLILLLASGPAPAQGFGQQDFDGRWLTTWKAGTLSTEEDRGISDGQQVGFHIGRRIAPDFMIEVEMNYERIEFSPASGNQNIDLNHNVLSFNAVKINPKPTWNPFFLGGIGLIDHNSDEISGADPMVQAGIGGMWDLNGEGVMLRADLRLRYDFNDTAVIEDKGHLDGIFSLALVVPLTLRD